MTWRSARRAAVAKGGTFAGDLSVVRPEVRKFCKRVFEQCGKPSRSAKPEVTVTRLFKWVFEAWVHSNDGAGDDQPIAGRLSAPCTRAEARTAVKRLLQRKGSAILTDFTLRKCS